MVRVNEGKRSINPMAVFACWVSPRYWNDLANTQLLNFWSRYGTRPFLNTVTDSNRDGPHSTLFLKPRAICLTGTPTWLTWICPNFFDRVNHDRLMSRLATRIQDKRVLKLIQRYLTAGAMIDGLVSPGIEGTPQGGPMSPLFSNIVLDKLDKELEQIYKMILR